jgi:DNA modification methylase
MIVLPNATVYHGSNLDVLPTLPDNSVDSIVTDPPYELGFMGKSWDNSGIAYSVELWTECMRVLKPGGHLLAFGGSRTWHRLAVAIEDAGFEMRDSIAWLYGSGFPKSMDVSKAIDKSDASEARRKRDLEFTAWMRKSGLTSKQIDEITDTNMGGHYLTAASQPTVATAELFDKLRPYLPEVPEFIEQMVAERTIESENYKKREVIGSKTAGMGSGKSFGMLQAEGVNSQAEKEIDITAPATPEAQKWQGWGTALKPAFEPVVVARKPLIGTVAANVLAYGTGGLNIDASRIAGKLEGDPNRFANTDGGSFVASLEKESPVVRSEGRWPANIILDPYTAELLDEQSGQSKSTTHNRGNGKEATQTFGAYGDDLEKVRGIADSGGASRFFYVAKASKKDRNEGLEELEEVRTGAMQATADGSMLTGSGNERTTTRANFHPTVKPTALMEYLIKLVTPEGGTVLDPFTGSGSTGKAALLNGYQFIGIELTDEYLPIIEGRLKWANEQANQEEEEKNEVLF